LEKEEKAALCKPPLAEVENSGPLRLFQQDAGDESYGRA
jgi:hypothetical protein